MVTDHAVSQGSGVGDTLVQPFSWPVASWEAESLQSLQSTGGQTVRLQRARKRPVLQGARDPVKCHD